MTSSFWKHYLWNYAGKQYRTQVTKPKLNVKEKKTLADEIVYLENNLNETNKDRLTILSDQLENLRQEKLYGHFTRARANWIENGDGWLYWSLTPL